MEKTIYRINAGKYSSKIIKKLAEEYSPPTIVFVVTRDCSITIVDFDNEEFIKFADAVACATAHCCQGIHVSLPKEIIVNTGF